MQSENMIHLSFGNAAHFCKHYSQTLINVEHTLFINLIKIYIVRLLLLESYCFSKTGN